MLRVLALDFDGVISNSAPEAFVVAVRTYAALRANATPGLVGDSIGDAAPTLEAVRDHPYFDAFVEVMPLGNRAEDYAVALAALESGHPLPDQAAYDQFRDRFDPKWLREFHSHFYRVRAEIAESDRDGWRKLMSPYQPFVEVIRRRAGSVDLSIATAKDRGSVRKLLLEYGIDELFPEDLVLDKDAGVTKTAHLEHLRGRFGCRFEEMTFVDDKVSHLDDVARLGVRCALAGWGFNGPRESELARASGHLVCSLDDVEDRIFG